MRLLLFLALTLSAADLKLTPAWTYDTKDSLEKPKRGKPPALEVTPVYDAGRLYISTPRGTVAALQAVTGREIWRVDLRVNPEGNYGDFANRGVSLRGTRLYLGTVDGRLVCLEKSNGAHCNGFAEIDLTQGLRRAPRYVGEYGVTSAPAIFKDLVITGSAIADNSRLDMATGEVRAYDAMTGKLRWTFHPLPADSKSGAANTWSRITVDEASGLVFLPTGSASPDYYGGMRPGDNRHANSIVALEGATGKVVWAFQTVHHDIWDYDVASPPELYEYKGRKAIAVGSKTGHLFLLDRLTGKPIFGVEERAVPTSDDAYKTQPFPLKPPALVRQQISEADIHPACLDTFRTLRNEGIFTPPSVQGSLIVPGNIGGMHWGGVAWARKDKMLVIPVNDLPAIIRLIPKENFQAERKAHPSRETTEQKGTDFAMSREFFMTPDGRPCLLPPWGSLVGVNVETGDIAWKVKLGDLPNLGGLTVSKAGHVFVGAELGPYLRAFNAKTGAQLGEWKLPTSARAKPMTFVEAGKEYVVIAAGGHDTPLSKLDTKIVAFEIHP
ncbi:PQQ-binding-like beta-propeller repeat protein [Bryobacter aggregatus]|uniref:outer membrane protein assembly factor BamB family protein n=1 Tax=Bryobacter aggregatus TaxID=360054 RepID=UPI000691F991|nr:PQQ-binding-like beta-propeller repeat protein [Bryobacter aggregatus]